MQHHQQNQQLIAQLNPAVQFSQPVPSQHQMQNQTQILLYPFSAQNTNSRVVNLLNESYDSLTSAN